MSLNPVRSEALRADQAQQKLLIRAAEIQLLYDNANVGTVVTTVATTVLGYLQWNYVSHWIVVGWWLYMFLVAAGRFTLARRYHRSSPPSTAASSWGAEFTAGAGLAGAGWGVAGILLYPETSLTSQVFLIFVLGGMMLGAASLLAPWPQSFLAFLVPTGTAPTIRLLLQGDEAHVAMGLLGAIFTIATVATTWRFHLTIVSSLKLRFENQELVKELQIAKDQAEALNQQLEVRVLERTAALQQSTEQLRAEIAQREQIEQDLIRWRDRLARAQASAHLGSWQQDLKTGELTWSEETYRIFGLVSTEPVTLELFIRAVHPEDRERVRRAVDKALQTRGPYELEHRVIQPGGQERVVHEHADVIIDAKSGQLVNLLGTVQDITERKQLEEQFQQAQKMEAVGRLAGGIAHDFNNLLTVILGYGDLLVHQGYPGSEAVEEILKAASRAASLTRQLLAFSRRQVLQPKTLNLNASVRNIRPMLERILGEDIDLTSILQPGLWNVSADPGQIDQVIMNIVVNARDAMLHGGKLIIETTNIELDESYAGEHMPVAPGHYVLLAITDTGCGMDAATRARLFEPFFTTKEKGKGTGLGLSSVYGIIKQSGGYVWVYSEPGKGTTLKIYLPRNPEAVLHAESRPLAKEQPAAGRTILLVEDEAAVRRMSALILREHGYEVLEAPSAEAALEICKMQSVNAIDLLITDLVLPKMDGRQVAQELIKQYPTMVVLYSSGYTEHAVLDQGVFEAGTFFLHKPFTPTELLQNVYKCLNQT